MKIDQDTLHLLQKCVELLILLKVVQGNVNYEIMGDIAKWNRFEVVNISISPKTTV